VKEIYLNSNQAPQAKKKLILLQNWILGPFCHRKTFLKKRTSLNMAAAGKEKFI